jgi:hypothetical protein
MLSGKLWQNQFVKAFTDTIGLRVIGGFGVFDVIEGK